MITVKIPFRGQGAGEMNMWLVNQGLVYQRDWAWDNNGGMYVYKISPEYSKIATIFTLKWS